MLCEFRIQIHQWCLAIRYCSPISRPEKMLHNCRRVGRRVLQLIFYVVSLLLITIRLCSLFLLRRLYFKHTVHSFKKLSNDITEITEIMPCLQQVCVFMSFKAFVIKMKVRRNPKHTCILGLQGSPNYRVVGRCSCRPPFESM